MIQAGAGLLAMNARLRGGRMRGDTMQHGDLYAGMMACQGILAALFDRERTGEGQHIDVSMAEALLYVNEHASAEIAGHDGSSGFPSWHFESYVLGDGGAVHVLGMPEQIFPVLAHALPIQGALEDSRFASEEARRDHRDALVAVLDEALARVPDHPALVKLLERSPAVVVPVRSTAELAASEWADHRALVTEAGPGLFVPTAPWRSRDAPIGAPTPHIAKRGEHNAEILGDWLGRDATAVQALEAAGVLEFSAEEPPTLDEAPRSAFKQKDAP